MGHISVIMSVYKNDDLLSFKVAINSILSQTYKNFELIICKDGYLPHNLDQYIKELIRLDDRITVLSNNVNLGLAPSLNKLIDFVLLRGKSDYIARMDSDDISHSDRFQKQIEYIHKHKLDICGSFCKEFGSSYALDEKKLPISHNELVSFSIARCPFIHPTVIFNIKVFQSGIRYPENTSFSEDMALWFVLIENGFIFGNVPEILLNYRLTESTVSRRLGLNKAYSEMKLRITYMLRLKRFNVFDFFKIILRLPFHLLPVFVVKIVYKYLR